MASFRCFSFMAIIFLANSFFSFNGCHSDEDLINGVCKQSQDYNYCDTTMRSDPRTAAVEADLHGLALISISLTVLQIQDTLGRIPDIIGELNNDPIAQQRLGICQNNYDSSMHNFQSSFYATSNNAYSDSTNFVRDGTNQVIDCHNSFRMNGPIATSPIAGDDIHVFKLSEIILLFISRLIS